MSPKSIALLVLMLMLAYTPRVAFGQNTSFSYQGFFKQNNAPANGNFHFEFALYDQPTFGSQLGTTLILDPVAAVDGSFLANLDFGNQFNGANRYLEIRVRPSSGGTLILLTPRQVIQSVPNALNSNNLGGLPAASYIQNSTGQQANANISISGSALFGGNVGIGTLTPSANLNIVGTQPPLNSPGDGLNAATALEVIGATGGNTAALDMSRKGGNGSSVTIRGGDGGRNNNFETNDGDGGSITLQPGLARPPGSSGAVLLAPTGGKVGIGTTTPAALLSIVGTQPPGQIGTNATSVLQIIGGKGGGGTPGGSGAGVLIQGGEGGQFDGNGGSITLQPGAGVGNGNPGNILMAGTNGRVGIGNVNPQAKLDVNGRTLVNGAAATAMMTVTNSQTGIIDPSPANLPPSAVLGDATSTVNANVGVIGNSNGSNGAGIVGIGNGIEGTGVVAIHTGTTGQTSSLSAETLSPNGTAVDINMPTGGNGYLIYASSGTKDPFQRRKEGSFSTKFSVSSAGQVDIQGSLNLNGTFNSQQLSISNSNLQTLGNLQSNNVTASQNVSVGGFLTAPGSTLQINRDVNLNGTLTPQLLGGGDNHLCNLAPTSTLRFCSSSLRYKENVQPFKGGLDIIKRLNPISFDWKENGRHDVGLGAEDVATVEPRLTFNNPTGEIEGVKYAQLNVVLINAIKEQQLQIERQQAQINALTRRLDMVQKRNGQRKVR